MTGTTRAAASVLAAAVLWGTVGAAQELGAPTASPAAVAGVRSLLGGLLLLASVLVARRGHQVVGVVRGAPLLAAGAVVSITVFQLGYLGGIRAGGVAVGTLLAIGSAPAFAGLAAWARRRPPGARWMVATAITIVGAALLLLAGGGDATTLRGGALSIGAGASFAAYTLLAKGLLERGLSGPAVMAVVFTGSGVVLLPVLVTGGAGWVLTGVGAVTAVWLAAATTLVGYRLFARGLSGVDAPTAATLTLAEPLTAAALGVVVIGERLNAWSLAGAGLLLVGLVVTAGARRSDGPRRRRRVAS